MKLEKNEEVLLKKLRKSGLTDEMAPFSIRKALHHVVLTRRRVRKIVRHEEFIVSTLVTKVKWMNKLKEKGLVDVDYSDKWNPKVKFTEEGKQALEKLKL